MPIIYQAYSGLDLLRQVEIAEPTINQDSHAIKSFLIAHKSCLSGLFYGCVLVVVNTSGLMERSDEQRDPDVQELSVLGFANI